MSLLFDDAARPTPRPSPVTQPATQRMSDSYQAVKAQTSISA